MKIYIVKIIMIFFLYIVYTLPVYYFFLYCVDLVMLKVDK